MPSAICPKCKDRRVIFDPIALLTTIALPLGLFVEAGSDIDIFKRECPTCDGKDAFHFLQIK